MEDYLIHHGIMGMKWGVRRSPSALGKAGVSTVKKNKIKSFGKKVKISSKKLKVLFKKLQEKHKENKIKNKPKDKLSDDELKKRVNRMELELRYKNLKTQLNPKKQSIILKSIKKVGNTVLDSALKDIGASLYKNKVKKYIVKSDDNIGNDKKFKKKENSISINPSTNSNNSKK